MWGRALRSAQVANDDDFQSVLGRLLAERIAWTLYATLSVSTELAAMAWLNVMVDAKELPFR